MSPAVEHLVLLKVKDGSPDSKLTDLVNGLKTISKLPGILEYNFNRVVRQEHSDFTHVLQTRFVSRQALDDYDSHPDHVHLVHHLLLPAVDNFLVFDFEDSSAEGGKGAKKAGATHIVLMKPKEGVETLAVEKALERLRAQGEEAGTLPVRDVRIGAGINPKLAQGYTWGLVSLHASEADLEAFLKDPEVQLTEILVPMLEKWMHAEAVPQ